MKTVAIVDFGMGNLDSVARAVEENGGRPLVTDDPRNLEKANYIVLPGDGSFSAAMHNMRELKFVEALTEEVMNRRVPFLGLCLGMQLLATTGMEGEVTKGFGWIDGEVKRLEPDYPSVRIPHIGWNDVLQTRASPLFEGIPSGTDFYFVHSYHIVCSNEEDVLARTPYSGGFVSAVQRENILGVQFHPEKSQRHGFQLLKNFLKM